MSDSPQIKTALDFGSVLRTERTRRGMTQASLAAKADVSVRWLSNFERGKSPRAELIKVVHVARALDLVFEVAPERVPSLSARQTAIVNAMRVSTTQQSEATLAAADGSGPAHGKQDHANA